jgi:hypothetical protein
MRVVVFADVGWSVGRVHKDVSKYLYDTEFIFIDWYNFTWDGLVNAINNADVCLTNIVSLKYFHDWKLPINLKRCLFLSHGFIDNNATPIELMKDDLVYGVTSDSIRQLFPLNRTIFTMPNGVEPSHFKYRERNGDVNVLGWCGATGVASKQIGWAYDIADQTDIQLSIGDGMTFEQIVDWYGTIDVLLITSIPNGRSETGPLPAFEAIVSGVLVIGTLVGNFKNIPGPKFDCVADAVLILQTLRETPMKVKEIAREQYEYVMENCTYSSFAYKWQEALEYVSSR